MFLAQLSLSSAFLKSSLCKSKRLPNNFSKQRRFTKIYSKAHERHAPERKICVLFPKITSLFFAFQKCHGRPPNYTLFAASLTKDLSNEVNFNKINVARSQNLNRPLIANININFLRKKLEILKEIIKIKADFKAGFRNETRFLFSFHHIFYRLFCNAI